MNSPQPNYSIALSCLIAARQQDQEMCVCVSMFEAHGMSGLYCYIETLLNSLLNSENELGGSFAICCQGRLYREIFFRFESLEDLVMKGAEARGKQGEDIMKLKTESAVFREGLAAADTSLRSLTATSSTHSRNLETAAAEGMQTAAKIKILQEETNNLLNMVCCFR